MRLRLRSLLVMLLTVCLCRSSTGQGTKADYQRMESLRKLTTGKVYRTNITPHWLLDGEHFWYRVRTRAKAYEFILVDLQERTRKAAFDHDQLASQLAEQTGQEIPSQNLPFVQIEFSDDLSAVYFHFDGRRWKFAIESAALSKAEERRDDRGKSPRSAKLKPSVDSGDELHVEFINESPGEVQTVWIDRTGKRVQYRKIGSGKRIKQHTFEGHVWLILNAAGDALEIYEANSVTPRVTIDGKTKLLLEGDKKKPQPKQHLKPTSPDGRWVAFVRDHQLYLRRKKTGKEFQLTHYANANDFFSDQRFFWSPDSKSLVALQVQPGQNRKIHMIESSPKDGLQPKLHTIDYVKPGDRIRTTLPHLFSVAEKKEIPLDPALYQSPWSLGRFSWREDSTEFSFLFNQRGHQVLRLVGIDAATGSVRSIIEEQSDTFIDYTNKVFISRQRNA